MSADERPRRRKLSNEDHALWRSITRSITPLKRRRAGPLTAAASEQAPKIAPAARAPTFSPRSAAPIKSPPPLVAIDRRLKQRLARGTVEIDARLDLHGRTQGEAYAALLRFLHRAQRDGLRTVLVITGKGGVEGGVLRRHVPFWLGLAELRAYVLGVGPANAAHGGEGALYVRLRRGR